MPLFSLLTSRFSLPSRVQMAGDLMARRDRRERRVDLPADVHHVRAARRESAPRVAGRERAELTFDLQGLETLVRVRVGDRRQQPLRVRVQGTLEDLVD